MSSSERVGRNDGRDLQEPNPLDKQYVSYVCNGCTVLQCKEQRYITSVTHQCNMSAFYAIDCINARTTSSLF